MTGTTKGTWQRPEAEPGAYAEGWERIYGVREVPEAPGSNEAGSTETCPSTEARGH